MGAIVFYFFNSAVRLRQKSNANMKTIAIFNQSGGVGKTTLTLNVGYQLAQAGAKVLLIDMEPQASLTVFAGLEPEELRSTIYECIMDSEVELPAHSFYGMDLVPANINLSGAELELVAWIYLLAALS